MKLDPTIFTRLSGVTCPPRFQPRIDPLDRGCSTGSRNGFEGIDSRSEVSDCLLGISLFTTDHPEDDRQKGKECWKRRVHRQGMQEGPSEH
jgi:hypothetical protein